MIRVHLTANVTLAAVAGICSPIDVSGMRPEVTPPVCVSESGEYLSSVCHLFVGRLEDQMD